jgi:uncharacterized protein RhaS with RHS repeats
MLARYYSSSLGRFMAVDPLGGALENPQSLNRYAYALNNPLRFTDPSGLAANGGLYGGSGSVGGALGDQPSGYSIADNHVGAERGQAGASDPIAARRDLADQIAHLPPEVRRAIPGLIKASNSRTADDKKGGCHEEGFFWGYDANGKVVISPSLPGAAADPHAQSGKVHWEFEPANMKVHGTIVAPGGFVHVHPAGDVHDTIHFEQSPSNDDFADARGVNCIHIVVGAYDRRIYFYDERGRIGDVSLKDAGVE